mmetsp:Transcript_26356/g.105504  ORF Transcript_26356/g.105504 Transcript_26356/m.105504 type:complete len:334 (-) Transcript_26356:1162-2163(-)
MGPFALGSRSVRRSVQNERHAAAAAATVGARPAERAALTEREHRDDRGRRPSAGVVATTRGDHAEDATRGRCFKLLRALVLSSAVKEHVGLPRDHALRVGARDARVVVVEPLVRVVVVGRRGVVAAAEAARVLRDGEEVVTRVCGRGGREDVVREVEVLEREVDEVVEFLAVDEVHVLRVLEALEVDDEDVGRRPEVELLEGARVLLALAAEPLLGLAELLALGELGEAVHDVDARRVAPRAVLRAARRRRRALRGRGVEVDGVVLVAVEGLAQRRGRELERQGVRRLQDVGERGVVAVGQLGDEARPARARDDHAVRLLACWRRLAAGARVI